MQEKLNEVKLLIVAGFRALTSIIFVLKKGLKLIRSFCLHFILHQFF